MKVWRIKGKPDVYRNLAYEEGFDYSEFLNSFDSPFKMEDTWKSPEIRFLEEEEDRDIGDFSPLSSGIICVTHWVADKLNKCSSDAIEVLNIKSLEGFSIIHVLDVCDCVDYEKSTIDYYSDMKRIMDIDEYVFKEDAIESKTIFKDSGFPTTDVFVTDSYKQEIESWSATGVEFVEYWDSEA